jgi:predicted nucleic acid-binding protein
MFLLDTNVLSELRRADRCDVSVRKWANGVSGDEIWLSVISILEIEQGILLISRRDTVQGARLRDWFEDQILFGFEGRILPVDTAVARRFAVLHVPDPRADRDALIAATALVHGLTVATRNVSDFEPTGVAFLNPWLDASG